MRAHTQYDVMCDRTLALR